MLSALWSYTHLLRGAFVSAESRVRKSGFYLGSGELSGNFVL